MSNAFHHWRVKKFVPVRSRYINHSTAQLVLGSVTTWESWVWNVGYFFFFLFFLIFNSYSPHTFDIYLIFFLASFPKPFSLSFSLSLTWGNQNKCDKSSDVPIQLIILSIIPAIAPKLLQMKGKTHPPIILDNLYTAAVFFFSFSFTHIWLNVYLSILPVIQSIIPGVTSNPIRFLNHFICYLLGGFLLHVYPTFSILPTY